MCLDAPVPQMSVSHSVIRCLDSAKLPPTPPLTCTFATEHRSDRALKMPHLPHYVRFVRQRIVVRHVWFVPKTTLRKQTGINLLRSVFNDKLL